MTLTLTSSEHMKSCIDNCDDCHSVCTETIAYCLDAGGEHADPTHIKLLIDCAEICQTSANFMIRGSSWHGATCDACAKVCESCADSCDALADGDDQMRACADACRRCAASCREMAA